MGTARTRMPWASVFTQKAESGVATRNSVRGMGAGGTAQATVQRAVARGKSRPNMVRQIYLIVELGG